MRAEHLDLVGTPWREPGSTGPGLSCADVTALYLGRLGLPVPPLADDWIEESLARWIASERSPWLLLGRCVAYARKVGDIVWTEPEGAQAAGVGVVVQPGSVLTSTRDRGVQVVPARAIRGRVSVWRWRGYP